jgi:hypothetical protein
MTRDQDTGDNPEDTLSSFIHSILPGGILSQTIQ